MSPSLFTADQLGIIHRLIEEARESPTAMQRRWPGDGGGAARALAEQGHLLLLREWTVDVVVSAAGEFLLVDQDNGEPKCVETSREARITLFRSIKRYPELTPLLPARPNEALMCPQCQGSGVIPLALVNLALDAISCSCGGAGWTLHD